MTTRYRVEYALKSHRRDELIEWVKALMAVPFVLHSQPQTIFEPRSEAPEQTTMAAQKRYLEIMRDVEDLITDHIRHQKSRTESISRLKFLVPAVGNFFTPLSLADAFIYQDARRSISWRRFVAPSFNDIRLTLNTAQVMSLVRLGGIELVTFDGDVTLYEDGGALLPDAALVPRLMALLAAGTKIGIVTAAGYTSAKRYYERLYGLLDAVHASDLPSTLKENLIVLGGETNYLYKFSQGDPDRLKLVPRKDWLLNEMRSWQEEDIQALLDLAELTLKDCIKALNLEATILRKERAVGFIPEVGHRFPREALEETVLVTQKTLELSAIGRRVPFCAFNGGNDVFVDIGDKSFGVRVCQKYFHGIDGSKTLHIGDQFLSAGANDFKARAVCCTAWVANPRETTKLLDEIAELDSMVERKKR